MKTHLRTSVALVSMTLLAGGGFAAAQPNNDQSATAQQNSGQAAPNAQESAQLNQQASQEVIGQLRQIAQNAQSAPDKLFLLNSGLDSMAEVAYSQQIAQKAQNQEVKNVAQKFVQDHERMNQKLMQIAPQLGVTVPQALPTMKQMEVEIKSSLSGQELEQQFIASGLAEHDKDIACFQAESTLGQNQSVKQFAAEFLPVLQEHRRLLDQLAQSMNLKIQSGEGQAVPASATINGSGGGTNQGNTPNGSESRQQTK